MSQESNSTKSVESSDRTTHDPDSRQYRRPSGRASWRSLATTAEYECRPRGIRFDESELLDCRDRDTSDDTASRNVGRVSGQTGDRSVKVER